MVAVPPTLSPDGILSRRVVLSAAMAMLAPSALWAQWPKAGDIAKAAQDARREFGAYVRLTDNLLRLTVADGAERLDAAVRRFRAERANIARKLAAQFAGRFAEDDWPLLVPPSELDLQLAIQPLALRLVPSAAQLETEFARPLPDLAPVPDQTLPDALLTLVLGCLGLGSMAASGMLLDRFKGDDAVRSALGDLASALRGRRYGLVALEFERLMRFLMLPRNTALIAELAGREALRGAYLVILAYFVPFVGWSFFTAYLLATVYDNRDGLAPLLR